MQFDREWLDFGTAKSHEKRIEFLAEAWEAAAATGTVASGGSLQQGDVLYFYTQRIHRAPPPPPPGSPRYMLYCSLAPSARRGAPRTRRCWQAHGRKGGAPHLKNWVSLRWVQVSNLLYPYRGSLCFTWLCTPLEVYANAPMHAEMRVATRRWSLARAGTRPLRRALLPSQGPLATARHP